MGRSERQRAEAWGRRAEFLTVLALGFKGYRVLQRRWRSHAGEIDLVLRRGQVLVAVEVKARSGAQDHLVSITQWRRIAASLEALIARRP
ncbi:MAG: YraN family protein [Alphaproteobacteria bacterium]|jgi:putative endonuclease|nr:YraN family protein [Alphaproteobacteria bacterium]